MKKILFIDGPNLMFRAAYANQDLTHADRPTGMLYGFFRSMLLYARIYPLHQIVVCWDTGHAERDALADAGVAAGIIPEGYKANRKKNITEEQKLIFWQIEQQIGDLKTGLAMTRAIQVEVPGHEADDIIGTYVLNDAESEIVLATSDKDYYQLLERNVIMDDQLNGKKMDYDTFTAETGLASADLWVDVGALMGDAGDNIFGAPGIGPVNAQNLVKEHGTAHNVIRALEAKYAGVDPAKVPKKMLSILQHKERVLLAFKLKQMIMVPNLPALTPHPGDCIKLEWFFDEHGFTSLKESISLFA
jgi:DNA polymerase-1